MGKGFFYSKSTGLYVAREPIKIDSRVKKATEKNEIKIQWDDEGRLNFVDFDDAKKILLALSSSMMSPVEYWKVLADAKKEDDLGMVHELTSDKYCEWLDRIYLIDGTWIDHPKLMGDYQYNGVQKEAKQPVGKPGWFNPENNIDFENGVPKKIELFRDKFETSWKYWSPDFSVTQNRSRAVLRGYVTSVGKPSFDQGIPVDSKQPVQVIRECRKEPLEPLVPLEVLNKMQDVLKYYIKINQNLFDEENYKNTYSSFDEIVTMVFKYASFFQDSKEVEIYKIRENLFNLLGLLKIMALKRGKSVAKLDEVAKILSGVQDYNIKYEEFLEFIQSSKKRLNDAMGVGKDIVFVMGHKNPDTDTVISSLLEAWRNHLLDGNKFTYIPIVQNYKIPDETRHLLGDLISNNILLDKEEIYKKVKSSGLARWISVDQNREPEVQKYFISIIDHHIVSNVAKSQDIPKTLELVGSCTSLIAQKFLGMGLIFDKKLSEIFYGATLMDTENRVFHKMTPKDVLIMDYLKKASDKNDDCFYADLMSFLLNTDDPNILFGRDYKEDWGFGFGVAKIKGGFSKEGEILKKELIEKTVSLAEKNNLDKNLPLTILRITDYENDNITVNREKVFLIFNKESSPQFKETILNLLEKIVRFEFGDVNLRKSEKFVEFWGTGMQLSRKKTAPVLEPIVKIFHEYFYSPSIQKWIKREFLKKTNNVISAGKKLHMDLSFGKKDRINYINYLEAKKLVENLGFSLLSLKEYWQVLNDAKKINDLQMIESLQGSNFVEFLDTVIKDYEYIVEHPKIKKEGERYILEGISKKVVIPKGKPGLIHPNQINLETGIPKEVKPPSEYGNPELWRYWEPDLDLVIPVRSYIFLLKQPCWDGKFHIRDSFPNLGIRPCCENLPLPKVKMDFDEEKLNIKIEKEGDVIEYSWKK